MYHHIFPDQNKVLATAVITYHLPDYPDLLQTYVWQQIDTLPDFPELKKFLDFWVSHLDGQLHSVTVSGKQISTADFQVIGREFFLN